ncbi:MAG: flagellar basal body rod protein FlgB [Candidatus Sericytochromatia bacterium]|nr:flagellar basal body rod protein FlgB [Candidatus Sericytochromatia bacterium]
MFDQIRAVASIYHPALDGLSARQRAISNNLANADTPGYKAQDVAFETRLQQKIQQRQGAAPVVHPEASLATPHPRHLPLGLPQDQPYTLSQLPGSMKNDGNGVDLEQEMTRMSQAQLSYTTVSQLLTGAYGSLKYVISEGNA